MPRDIPTLSSVIRRFAVAILVSLYAAALPAATVSDLQTAVVPVADNSDAEFTRGLEAAFQVVLTKLTGNSQSAKLSAIAKLRARARQYNTLFGYERAPDGAPLLRADFDLPAVSGALRERGLPVWGRDRPQVIAWLVLADAAGRRAAPDQITQEIFDSFKRQATLRAIPIRLLAPDATADAVIRASGAEDELFTGLGTIAAQYEAPVRLVLLLAQTADALIWQARWRLDVDEETLSGDAMGDLPVPLVTTSLDQALDAVAHHYLQTELSSATSTVDLAIEGVSTADAYGRTLNYLAQLDAVKRVDVLKIEGTTVFLQVTAHGGLPAVAQSIGFGQVLRAVPETSAHYRLSAP
jgi:hypothetical protein